MSISGHAPSLDSKLITQAIEILTTPLDVGQAVKDCFPDLAFFKTLQKTSSNFKSFVNSTVEIREAIGESSIEHVPPRSLSCIAPENLAVIYYEYTFHLLQVSTLVHLYQEDRFINISTQKQGHKLFQFIFSLCIVPFLLPGNGVPISERSVTLQYLIKHKSKLTPYILTYHLIRCCDVILKQSNVPCLVPSIRDVVASLLQISHYTASGDVEPGLALKCVWYRENCSDLIGRFETPLVVSEILILQGLARKAGAKWLINATTHELSKILIRRNGMQSVIRGFLDVISKGKSPDALDYTKLKAIATVIANNPVQERIDSYYTSLCGQILEILHLREGMLRRDVITAGICVAEALVVNKPSVAKELLLDRISSPMDRVANDGTASMNEFELSQTISDFHDVITRIPEWHCSIDDWISKYVAFLFHILCYDSGKITPIRSKLSQIIEKYFLHARSEHCISFVTDSLFYFHSQHQTEETDLVTLHPDLTLRLGGEGSFEIVRGQSENDIRFFVTGLFQFLDSKEKCSAYQTVIISVLNSLADLVEGRESCQICSAYGDGVLYLVAQLFEERGEYILSELSTEQIIQWASRLVRIHYDHISGHSDIQDYNVCVFGGSSSLSIAFGSLTYLLSSSKEVSVEASKLLQGLLPYLEVMGDKFPDELLRTQSADLRICLATCGAVWSHQLKPESDHNKLNESCDTSAAESDQVPTNHGSNEESAFSQALALSLDPLLPIRANGIQQLSKLVYKRDAEALDRIDELMQLFKENIVSEDSYLYLAAINGMAALAFVRPEQVFLDISTQYAAISQQASRPLVEEISSKPSKQYKVCSRFNTVEFRMKLGEILIHAARESGELFPRYGGVILSAILSGVRDEEPMVRASALSNLAESCLLLGYSLSGCVEEVVGCLEQLIPVEQEAMVRRAAVLVLTRILDKPQDQIMHIFGGRLLRRSYQLLKRVDSSDPDSLTRTHAQCGLERLSKVMIQFLTPLSSQGELKKTLFVLDAPPAPFDWSK